MLLETLQQERKSSELPVTKASSHTHSEQALEKERTSKKKSQLGQFFTPASVASFMAGLFTLGSGEMCRLLDAGAGEGALSAAFLKRCASGHLPFERVEVDAFEVDRSLHPCLTLRLADACADLDATFTVHGRDFIFAATEWLSGNLFAEPLPGYTHAILNPPYKKIRSDSEHRLALRSAGIETVNLYSAFVALSLALLEDSGQLAAIIPRSFCNGPYYRPFRKFLLERAALRRIHLFDSRVTVFKEDSVLQENVILHLERAGKQGPVTVSTSTDDGFADMTVREHPFERIVMPDDPEQFINVPTSSGLNRIELSDGIRSSVDDLKISVSTGPVVDFRLKEYLRGAPSPDSVPLLYPCHFNGGVIEWPKTGIKKPNAIQFSDDTRKWLYPNGYYCVVRRFSSKEEKRRIVANVVEPGAFAGAPKLGFENHLNVFHDVKKGLSRELAFGLALFLNSTAADEYFRRFNGHTQVNATDLRLMKYPSLEILVLLGELAAKKSCACIAQREIDSLLESVLP